MGGKPQLDLQPFLEEYEKEIPKELLHHLYHEKELSLERIGYLFKVSGNTVAKLMKFYDLKRRNATQTVKLRKLKSGRIGRGDLKKGSVK